MCPLSSPEIKNCFPQGIMIIIFFLNELLGSLNFLEFWKMVLSCRGLKTGISGAMTPWHAITCHFTCIHVGHTQTGTRHWLWHRSTFDVLGFPGNWLPNIHTDPLSLFLECVNTCLDRVITAAPLMPDRLYDQWTIDEWSLENDQCPRIGQINYLIGLTSLNICTY